MLQRAHEVFGDVAEQHYRDRKGLRFAFKRNCDELILVELPTLLSALCLPFSCGCILPGNLFNRLHVVKHSLGLEGESAKMEAGEIRAAVKMLFKVGASCASLAGSTCAHVL